MDRRRLPPLTFWCESNARTNVKAIDVIASGTRARQGFDLDYAAAFYQGDDVHVSATDNTLIIPSASFDRLIARLLRGVVDAAKKNGAAVTNEPRIFSHSVASSMPTDFAIFGSRLVRVSGVRGKCAASRGRHRPWAEAVVSNATCDGSRKRSRFATHSQRTSGVIGAKLYPDRFIAS